MEALDKIVTDISVETSKLTMDVMQRVLINARRFEKSSENDMGHWNQIAQILWCHIQSELNKVDEQLLCATCFFSALKLIDEQEGYLKKMQEILTNEINQRCEDVKVQSNILQAVSLMYGMFQSSFLTQNTKKNNTLAEVFKQTFYLLTLMGYEYSQFTFIAFKIMNSFKKVYDTELNDYIFSEENQIKLLNLVNHNWENPITGVRDLNRGIFQTLILNFSEVTSKSVVNEINSFYWNKAKYLMLSEVIEYYKGDISSLVLGSDWIEGLTNSLYKPGLVSAGADMYYAVLKKINSEDDWCKLFLSKILDILSGSSNKAIENFCNYWCLATFTCNKFSQLMNILIKELEKIDNEQCFYSILFLMKQGNRIAILNKNWNSSDKIIKTEKLVLCALEHHNTQVRILAFDIVCLSHSKTLPSKVEYNLVLEYLQTNINSDCTVLRLSMLSSLNRFLSHLHFLFRNTKDIGNVDAGLLDFCKRLQEFIISSVNVNGNYQRKISNVKVINTVIDSLTNIPRKRKDHTKATYLSLKDFLANEKCWILHDPSTIMKLINLLKDPSEDIRNNIGKLLLNHYSAELKNKEVMDYLLHEALQCMKSKYFYEINCGQCIFKLIANLLLKEKLGQAIFKNIEDVFNYSYKELCAEYELKQDVLKSIEDGKQLHSFISILHVVLESCITNSHKLNVSDDVMNELLNVLQGITNQFTWQQQNSTCSDFSEMNEMVESIIAKSGCKTIEENDETKISGFHQVVLNSLWLNVKTSCELAALLIHYNIDDVDKCGKCLTIITHVLETSRHKGAIEAAGAALGRGIQCLTNLSKDSKVYELPHTLLTTKLDILISETSKMSSITRRGAGLSIMVHRIVSSDMQKGKPLFHYFMKTLLKTCKNTEDVSTSQDIANIENQMDLPKAIFIHFLTRIVTDSSLASDMMFYSVELAELAFCNLTSAHWQIRNAALQLYGALIPRLIGQKKASGMDEETIATVACDELRTHSLKLWNFITEQLETDNHSDRITYHSNLVPILNMLASTAKRYNFSSDSKKHIASDQEMAKRLLKTLDSPIHVVRRLTAKCIFNICSFEDIYNALMNEVFVSENSLHGALLLLKCCHKYYNHQNNYKNALKNLLEKFDVLLKLREHSYWSKEVFVSIYSTNLNINDVNEIFVELDKNVHDPGIFLWANACIKTHILNCQWKEIPKILCSLLECNDFETYLKFLFCKIESDSTLPELILKEIIAILLSFKNKYHSNVIWKILYEISLKITMQNIDVNAILKDFEGREISYKLRYIIPFATRLIITVEDEYQKKLGNIIYKLSNFENADIDMRYIAALANNELANTFEKLSEEVKIYSIKSAILLLQDEDESVRNVCVNYYKNIRMLKTTTHANICLNKILDYNFLQSIFSEPKRAIQIVCEDLLNLVSSNSHVTDEYNPFVNDSKNIYLEVDVFQQSLENLRCCIE